jgi:hypothetical protein
MAYNVLKGIVEGSVDQYGDQEIGGVKVFKNTISASVFYDTDAQSPCATMKDVAITNIKGGSQNSLLVCDQETGARSYHDLTYDGEQLQAKKIAAGLFEGSASQLSDLPADKFTESIPARFIKSGPGLVGIRDALQVKTGQGLRCDEIEGIELNILKSSALSIKDRKLCIEPSRAEKINSQGQNLSDNDLLIVGDISRGSTNSTTLRNLYDSYIKPKVPRAAGTKGQLQLKGAREFESSEKLTYDSAANLLKVEGKIRTDNLKIDSKLICEGSVHHNIKKINTPVYEIQKEDYTVLCDNAKNKVKVKLPPASNNHGRILIIKKTNSDKQKIASSVIEVSCEEGPIDSSDTCIIKMNYSTRTFQSDGDRWWLIGGRGT